MGYAAYGILFHQLMRSPFFPSLFSLPFSSHVNKIYKAGTLRIWRASASTVASVG